jgi:hypothetical protein
MLMRAMQAMAVVMNRGRLIAWGRGLILRILTAKAGFAFDRLQTFLESREPAIGGAAGKIRAPLSALSLSLCLSAQRVANKKNPNDR